MLWSSCGKPWERETCNKFSPKRTPTQAAALFPVSLNSLHARERPPQTKTRSPFGGIGFRSYSCAAARHRLEPEHACAAGNSSAAAVAQSARDSGAIFKSAAAEFFRHHAR